MTLANEKRINNTIYLMHTIVPEFMKNHNMSIPDFLELDKNKKILNFIAECPDIFDGLPNELMQKELEEYINEN